MMKEYSSPFPKENRLDIIIDDITTLYKERTDENFQKIVDLIESSSGSIKGNVAVFFPSYWILKKINSMIDPRFSKPIIIENQGMNKKEKSDLYKEFVSYSKTGAVLFAVIGGSFSEGVDMPGDLLNGVIIIGLPLERPTKQTEALIDYYNKLFKRGQGATHPTLLVLEEAHHYLRQLNDNDETGKHSLAYERLAKEGRKFGISIWLSTQRPSELSSTVLSQCGTWVVFRLASEQDLRAVSVAAEWVDKQEVSRIAGLPRRQAVIFGSCVALPTRITSPTANPTPKSHDPDFKAWTKEPMVDDLGF
jgi:hypothetical protein